VAASHKAVIIDVSKFVVQGRSVTSSRCNSKAEQQARLLILYHLYVFRSANRHIEVFWPWLSIVQPMNTNNASVRLDGLVWSAANMCFSSKLLRKWRPLSVTSPHAPPRSCARPKHIFGRNGNTASFHALTRTDRGCGRAKPVEKRDILQQVTSEAHTNAEKPSLPPSISWVC
jgi:hypothetical protein